MTEEKEDKEPEIKWVDGMPCIVLPPGSLQENKKRQSIPDIIREFENIFNIPSMPVKWKIFEITKQGEIKEIKQEDEEDDNRK